MTNTTRTIQGVHATAVDDRLYERGKLAERTTDWYAQDRAGNVWYFGERTAELSPGQGAVQEHYKGHAEDHFAVLTASRTALLTNEWTPLEPGVLDHKHYRRGVGTVLEQTVTGGNERNALVSFHRGA